MTVIVYPQPASGAGTAAAADLTPVLDAIAAVDARVQGIGATAGGLPPGYIAAHLAAAVPEGWYPLDGSAFPSVAQHPVLYALFGTAYSQTVDELSTRAGAGSLVPAMTGPTTSGYVASASSEYAGGAYPAWEAFDSTTAPSSSSAWISADGATSAWLQISMPEARAMSRYEITSRSSTGADPKSWALLGSHDGVTWTLVDQRSGETGWGDAGVTRVYEVDAARLGESYSHYRIDVSAYDGTGYLAISQLALYGGDPVWVTAPDGHFGLPNLKSSPTPIQGGVWCIKAG